MFTMCAQEQEKRVPGRRDGLAEPYSERVMGSSEVIAGMARELTNYATAAAAEPGGRAATLLGALRAVSSACSARLITSVTMSTES